MYIFAGMCQLCALINFKVFQSACLKIDINENLIEIRAKTLKKRIKISYKSDR